MTAPSNPFDEASILADARAADGLTDFGDDAFLVGRWGNGYLNGSKYRLTYIWLRSPNSGFK